MKFAQLHYFYQKIWGDKRYYVPPDQKVSTCPPIPHALDVYLNNKSEFPITTFFSIAEILGTQMKKIEE